MLSFYLITEVAQIFKITRARRPASQLPMLYGVLLLNSVFTVHTRTNGKPATLASSTANKHKNINDANISFDLVIIEKWRTWLDSNQRPTD